MVTAMLKSANPSSLEPMAAKNFTLQLVGGGKMGEALIAGLIRTEWAKPDELVIVEVKEPRREALRNLFPGVEVSETLMPGVDTILAVKPHTVQSVCEELVGCGRVISIAAGIRTDMIQASVGADTTVLRVMPNTPALIGQGVSAVAAGSEASEKDVLWAADIMASVGPVVTVSEPELDAVTGLSGSGPAYVFAMAEALVSAGVDAGLSPEIAETLAYQTLYGAACLLQESKDNPLALRKKVTTPGGTTEAGLTVLLASLPDLVSETVAAATARSIELGAQ